MTVEYPIKKKVYCARCTCGLWEDSETTAPPRARMCLCGKEWCKYEEVTEAGPDLLLENK